ncbi:MAG: DNA polymerase III subunit epsilon [Pseudomonadota bacterium]|nr:DNA polymerase III subunit epsilon [Pseudomonadota bacterium]
MRQIVLDTETTGLEVSEGHRVIEIGCVEIINRRITGRNLRHLVNPEREIDEAAIEVHGITLADLAHKPRFADIVDEFLEFVGDAELVIHNAAFDLGFINGELQRAQSSLADITARCQVVDTLQMARRLHPGQRNNLDALCKRYEVDNSQRQLHGALLDAQILAEVYLAMTGGQVDLSLEGKGHTTRNAGQSEMGGRIDRKGRSFRVIRATEAELSEHQRVLESIEKASDGRCVWLAVETEPTPAEQIQ